MSGARALANHELYLARILLDCWEQALARQELPATALGEAFHSAVREHLKLAYGWFLLEVLGIDSLPGAPPAGCGTLPPLAPGKAEPGEIREFRQLEQGGWLGELLAAPPRGLRPAGSAMSNLAVPAPELPGPQRLRDWLEALETMFDRMGDSLDEC